MDNKHNQIMNYKSGDVRLQLEHQGVEDERAKYNFEVTIINSDVTFSSTDGYECPEFWTEEKIAADIITWALYSSDDAEKFFDAVVQDEKNTNDDIVLVEKLRD